MSDPVRLGLAFAVAFGLALVLTPLARRLALRTAFLDHPIAYKGHARPTPYLGGVAVVAAAVVSSVFLGGAADDLAILVACVATLHAVGTLDDRVNLDIRIRFGFQLAVAIVIWALGLGWDVFGSDVADLGLTVLWVVGLVNAFNLMDNLDGAAASVAAVSAAGAGILATIEGNAAMGAVALATAGACAGFLPYNLAKPSKIFLGDGGSMPIGLLVAVSVMAVPAYGAPYYSLLALVPLAGLPILDTTLVVVSRRRRRVAVFSGGRDHITHRLEGLVGTPLRVAACLGGLQAALCGVGIALHQLSEVTILAATAVYLVIGVVALWLLEDLYRAPDRVARAEEARVARQSPAGAAPSEISV